MSKEALQSGHKCCIHTGKSISMFAFLFPNIFKVSSHDLLFELDISEEVLESVSDLQPQIGGTEEPSFAMPGGVQSCSIQI